MQLSLLMLWLSFAVNCCQCISVRETLGVCYLLRDYAIVECFGILSVKLR